MVAIIICLNTAVHRVCRKNCTIEGQSAIGVSYYHYSNYYYCLILVEEMKCTVQIYQRLEHCLAMNHQHCDFLSNSQISFTECNALFSVQILMTLFIYVYLILDCFELYFRSYLNYYITRRVKSMYFITLFLVCKSKLPKIHHW